MMQKQVKVKCRKCGREAPAEQFTLDYESKIMVCPTCAREKKESIRVQAEFKAMQAKKKQETEKRPPGWDVEDDYLERASKVRAKNTVEVEKVDEEKVRYKCLKCNHDFLINIRRNYPGNCPFCGTTVSNYRIK